MKKLLRQFETSMMAVAFAEAGEFQTAQQIMIEEQDRKTGTVTLSKKAEEKGKPLGAI